MKKPDFRFLTDRMFLSGLFTGILISALIATIAILTTFPSPHKGKIKGTMAESAYVPAVGDIGTIQAAGTQCNAHYSDVIFSNDPGQTLFRCHSDPASVGAQVEVIANNGGQFCQGGGIFLSIVPVSN